MNDTMAGGAVGDEEETVGAAALRGRLIEDMGVLDAGALAGAESELSGEAVAAREAGVPEQAAKAPPVSTEAESQVGGAEAIENRSAADVQSAGAGEAATDARAAEGEFGVLSSPPDSPAVQNSPEREIDGVKPADSPDVSRTIAPAPEDPPPAGDYPAAPEEPKGTPNLDEAKDEPPHIPTFLRKLQSGSPPPVAEQPVRVGFAQLAQPEDFELVRVHRVSDPTRWYWARQDNSFLCATLVWERRAFMRSQYPDAEVLTDSELHELA